MSNKERVTLLQSRPTGKRMGRPISHGPVTLVTIDGKSLHHVDGSFHGDKKLVAQAWLAAMSGQHVRLHPMGEEITCSLNTALGIAAILLSTAPGRAVLVQAPVRVWEHLEEGENLYVQA